MHWQPWTRKEAEKVEDLWHAFGSTRKQRYAMVNGTWKPSGQEKGLNYGCGQLSLRECADDHDWVSEITMILGELDIDTEVPCVVE